MSFTLLQSLLFLRPDTLEGKKLHLYVILKFLKFVSGADVTSFKVMMQYLWSVLSSWFSVLIVVIVVLTLFWCDSSSGCSSLLVVMVSKQHLQASP